MLQCHALVFSHICLFNIPAIKNQQDLIFCIIFFFPFERLISKKRRKKTLPNKSGEKLSNSTGSFGNDEVLAKRVSMETNMLLRLKTHRVAFWTERGKKTAGRGDNKRGRRDVMSTRS